MEKKIEFTTEQKSLIFNKFILPLNGTAEDAKHFVEYCEQRGLNPILGDVAFQRFETKYGPRTSFLVTRDGLLRMAVKDPNYVGPPIANVVREGDLFEFKPSTGDVIHKFGDKRGKILGAYAVMKHKKFDTYAKWIDFNEYFSANANSQKGKSYIWDSYPSAMIEKTAEIFCLKRQFPEMAGLVTEEEIGFDVNTSSEMKSEPLKNQDLKPEPQNPQPQEVANQSVQAAQRTESPAPNQNEPSHTKAESMPQPEPQPTPQSQPESNQGQTDSPDQVMHGEIKDIFLGKSPTGTPFGKLHVKGDDGEMKVLLAQGEEMRDAVKELSQGQHCSFTIHQKDGFTFVSKFGSMVGEA